MLRKPLSSFATQGQAAVETPPSLALQAALMICCLHARCGAGEIARVGGVTSDDLSWHTQKLLWERCVNSTTKHRNQRLPQLVPACGSHYFLAGAKDKIMEPKYVRHLASFHPLFQACGDMH
jgi:hypothetical protein